MSLPAPVEAQEAYTFSNGFAKLADTLGPTVIGVPTGPEVPGDEPGSVIQRTTLGLAYWSPNHALTYFDGHVRYALRADRIVQWVGDALDPPPPPVETHAAVWDALANCESTGNWSITPQ